MLTEFEVRRRMESIQASRMAPLRKARLLLRLGRALNPQIESLQTAKLRISRTTNATARAGISRLAGNADRLREDLRDAAWTALCPEGAANLYRS